MPTYHAVAMYVRYLYMHVPTNQSEDLSSSRMQNIQAVLWQSQTSVSQSGTAFGRQFKEKPKGYVGGSRKAAPSISFSFDNPWAIHRRQRLACRQATRVHCLAFRSSFSRCRSHCSLSAQTWSIGPMLGHEDTKTPKPLGGCSLRRGLHLHASKVPSCSLAV